MPATKAIQVGRRGFMQAALAGFVSARCGAHSLSASASELTGRRKVRIGIQLYSVRKLCEKDFSGTLAELKTMGYAGVQCGGFFGHSAKELNTLFKEHGLEAAGVQMPADKILRPDNLPASIDFAGELGSPYLFIPHFDSKTADGWKRFGEQMATAADAFKKAGLRLGYHNHQHEFLDTFDGVCKWQILFDNTSQDVCQQMDLGHCMLAGQDPSSWLKKYPKRNPAVHVKAASRTTGVVGADGANWDKVLEACEADITEWYVVEAELRPDALDDVRCSIQFMKSKGRA